MERLIHDSSWAGACAMLDTLSPSLLRPEERREFFHEAYAVFRATLEAFCVLKAREDARINPSRN